jgi:hypothetical protein
MSLEPYIAFAITLALWALLIALALRGSTRNRRTANERPRSAADL